MRDDEKEIEQLDEKNKSCIKKIKKLIVFVFIFLIVLFFGISWGYEQYKIFQFKKKYENLNHGEILKVGNMHNRKASANLHLMNNGNVLISGGLNDKNIEYFEIFDINKGIFKKIKLPACFRNPRHSILLSENKVLINDSFIYDFLTQKYINIFKRQDYTQNSKSFKFSNEEILIIEQNKVYIYNINDDSLKNYPFSLPNISVKNFIKMDDNHILIYGDKSLSSGENIFWNTEFFLLNLQNNHLEKIKIDSIGTDVSVVKISNDEIILFANIIEDNNSIPFKTQVTYKVNVKNNNIIKLNSPLVKRKFAPVAILLTNNTILLFGGDVDSSKGYIVAEIYDPEKNEYYVFSKIKFMFTPQYEKNPAVVELLNGDIFICGGMYESFLLDKCVVMRKE